VFALAKKTRRIEESPLSRIFCRPRFRSDWLRSMFNPFFYSRGGFILGSFQAIPQPYVLLVCHTLVSRRARHLPPARPLSTVGELTLSYLAPPTGCRYCLWSTMSLLLAGCPSRCFLDPQSSRWYFCSSPLLLFSVGMLRLFLNPHTMPSVDMSPC